MTQLENELQNVVVSSEVNVMLNASSFSVYGFQCFFLMFFSFCFSKTYCITIKNVHQHLRLAYQIFRNTYLIFRIT